LQYVVNYTLHAKAFDELANDLESHVVIYRAAGAEAFKRVIKKHYRTMVFTLIL